MFVADAVVIVDGMTATEATTTHLQHIDPDGVTPLPGIHHVVVSRPGSHVHIGGQVPLDPTGELVGEDLASQAHAVFADVRRCVEAVGGSPSDLVRMRAYVVGLTADQVPTIEQAAFAELPGFAGPAVTLLGVAALFMPGQLIEVDADAVLADA